MPKVATGTTERVQGAKCEYSKLSQNLFNRILDFIDDKENVFFATHNGEFKLEHKFFDFKYKNKLIEFMGNYHHADPRLYVSSSKIMAHVAKDIWSKDREKDELAKVNGFELLRVWEDSYIKLPDNVLEICLEFILKDLKGSS